MTQYKLLIGAKLVDGDLQMDVVNPATEEVLAVCPRGSERQLNEAVGAARAAFKSWSRTTLAERRSKIKELADAVEARSDELARLLTQEQGKPLTEASAEINYTTAFLRYLASLEFADRLLEDGPSRRVEMRRKPLGVIGCIIPWNFPVLIVAFKAPLALLAGNTIIIKPGPNTPLTTLRIGELCAEIFPAGVVNIVTDQNDFGAAMTGHPDVARISFTGSTETGRKVMESAASTIKRTTLELGGNDAAIVMPDADPKEVAPGLFNAAMLNAGQVCFAIKRIYAHESQYDELCDEMARLADAAVVDDGLKQGSQIGPLQNRMQFEKVKGFLEDARVDGTIIAGGVVPDRPGFFIRPTIVRDVTDGSRIVDEEQFGPILPIVRYSDPEDALVRANNSPWGLGGSVWGKDRNAAYEIAREVESGTVWINKHLDFGPSIPFCGAKKSGLGVEFAEKGLYEFTQIQVINEAR